MLRKRRRVQQTKKITDGQFLSLLSRSELEIAKWHNRLPPQERSALLAIYFWFFPPKQLSISSDNTGNNGAQAAQEAVREA